MIKLFNAYFSRLGKWFVFRILVLLMIVCGTAVAIVKRDDPFVFQLPYMLSYLIFPHYIGVLIGLFNYPLFTNGTIRNQLSVGHSRSSIYVADWAVSNAFSAVLYLIVTLCLIGVGAVAGDPVGISVQNTVSGIILSTLHVILFATITQLFCMILKGVKSFLAIYLGNQMLVMASVGLLMLKNVPKALYYFFPTAVCMQLSSFDISSNPLIEGAAEMHFSFLPAAAAMLLEILLVLTAGILYFRKTDLN